MKILVFSDSHGNSSVMSEAIRKQLKHGLDMVFFLGDGISDFEAAAKLLPGPRYTAVLGNCDAYSYQPDGVYEKLIEAGGHRFLLAHGHRLGVKTGIQSAVDHAIRKGADVLLFGHTHEACDLTVDGSEGGSVRVINPGSCGSWYRPSFALLETVGEHLVCGFGG